MPVHDWTRVSAGTFHDFHCSWIPEIKNRLNQGILPSDYYAQVEQVAGEMTADVWTLRSGPPPGSMALYAARARHIAIRHSSGDHIVALIEVVSPGNKASRYAFQTFVDKAVAALSQGYHLLLIDLFPPGPC